MAEVGKVITCQSVDHWKELFNNGKEAKKLVVVDFTATWCGPCRLMAPILDDLAGKFFDVVFAKVDVDDLVLVAEEWKVEAMPTLVILKDGEEVARIVGPDKEALLAAIEKHAIATVTA